MSQSTPQHGAKILREFHHRFFDLYKRSHGIIVRASKENAHYTISETRDYVTALYGMTNGSPHAVLFLPAKNSIMDSASRVYLATDEALKYTKAVAGVLKTVAHRQMGNLYMEYNKPDVPLKFFDDEENAIESLHSQLEQGIT